VILEVLARAFNTVMKTLALRIAELSRGLIPVMVVVILRGCGARRSYCACLARSETKQRKSKHGKENPSQFHRSETSVLASEMVTSSRSVARVGD
jgi:hypothetical protein